MANPKVGFTFSQIQCEYLGLDVKETFNAVCDLHPNIIRLCCYWNEIEPHHNQWNFETIDWLLKQCEEKNIDVVLSLGMKSPRWPEFHFPEWVTNLCNTQQTEQSLDCDEILRQYCLRFISQVVEHTKGFKCINYYQVENEGLGRVGIAGNRFLSEEFLKDETELVTSLKRDDQKIVLTCAIDLWPPLSTEDTKLFEKSAELADAVGINVYTKVPANNSYLTPTHFYWQKLKKWQKHLEKLGKESWISELQAEPWEDGGHVHTSQMDYPSASPEETKNIFEKIKEMGYQTILLWGVEYWYWQKLHGEDKWWNEMNSIF